MLVLSKSWSFMTTKRLTELRAPVKLPSKSDIIKLRDCNKSTIQDSTGLDFVCWRIHIFASKGMLLFADFLYLMQGKESPLSELTDAMEDK